MSDGPEFVDYRIEAATVDGPRMPAGEAEFRIIGTIEEPPADCAEAVEFVFRIEDWAGPYPPQDVVFEHRAVLVSDGRDDLYGDVRGTYTEALCDAQAADRDLVGVWYCESRVAHVWKRTAMTTVLGGQP